MNKTLTFYFFCLLVFNSVELKAQETEEPYRGIYLRGKVSSFFIVEDLFWRNANIGAEFRLGNKHSIGVDYVFFRWRNEQDSIVDDIEYTSGPNTYRRREYINFDYRHYPCTHKTLVEKGIDPYFNLFTKIGKQKIWTQNDHTYHNSDYDQKGLTFQRQTFYELGVAGGLRWDFTKTDRFGLDMNIGVVKRFNTTHEEKGLDWLSGTHYEITESYKYSKWVLHMRMNLYLKLFKI